MRIFESCLRFHLILRMPNRRALFHQLTNTFTWLPMVNLLVWRMKLWDSVLSLTIVKLVSLVRDLLHLLQLNLRYFQNLKKTNTLSKILVKSHLLFLFMDKMIHLCYENKSYWFPLFNEKRPRFSDFRFFLINLKILLLICSTFRLRRALPSHPHQVRKYSLPQSQLLLPWYASYFHPIFIHKSFITHIFIHKSYIIYIFIFELKYFITNSNLLTPLLIKLLLNLLPKVLLKLLNNLQLKLTVLLNLLLKVLLKRLQLTVQKWSGKANKQPDSCTEESLKEIGQIWKNLVNPPDLFL